MIVLYFLAVLTMQIYKSSPMGQLCFCTCLSAFRTEGSGQKIAVTMRISAAPETAASMKTVSAQYENSMQTV